MKDAVTEEAASVAEDAKERGRDVAQTATYEAKDVAREAKTQLMQLLDQLRVEARTQASDQSRRAAQGLHSLGSELDQMATSSPSDGIANDLVRQAADRAASAARWFDSREPEQMLDEVRDFARRRPGTFLAGAAVLGIIGGRLTRGLAGGSSQSGQTRPTPGSTANQATAPAAGTSSALSANGTPDPTTGTTGMTSPTAPSRTTADGMPPTGPDIAGADWKAVR
ncbi:hypothetical protein ACWEOW_17435 [Monashia sp. NPDC004114]